MARIYHDEDADLKVLDDQTIALIGYGNQGRSQALNLRDSGANVIIGTIPDAGAELARRDGFSVSGIAEASALADIVMLLIPDEVMPEVFKTHVAPQLAYGDLVVFASGYNIAFDMIQLPARVDVALVAPRMIGIGVRETFLAGAGFPSFVCVHEDATGTARARTLAIAKGIGSTRAGCIEMSMRDEATLDLFTEQAFGPAFGRVLMSAIELLVEAGYPPEAVMLELYLSGELSYSLEKMREVGMMKQMDFHSRTSQYGTITRGARFLSLGDPIKQTMREVLAEIRSGSFADEWSTQQPTATALFERIREARDQLPVARWDESARAAFRIGNANGNANRGANGGAKSGAKPQRRAKPPRAAAHSRSARPLDPPPPAGAR
ncbi:MAG TPA: ketol-acid reductoisomerase [Myxococcota bacterium]|nr:ketol-acid reductoisomerase [Myxococcota bacterium]